MSQVAPDYALGLNRKSILQRFPGLAHPNFDPLDDLRATTGQYLPTLAAEVKGSGGTEDRAALQAQSYGTLMLRKLKEVGEKVSYSVDNNKILAISIVQTHYDVSVWGHWKVKVGRGKMSKTGYRHAQLTTVRLVEKRRATQLCTNAFSWAKTQYQPHGMVMQMLKLLEAKT